MVSLTDGCRLCLDPFSENAHSIENAELKERMEKVFHFTIDLSENLPSRVCPSCSYTISEFYQYSEKVRLNQEKLATGSWDKQDDEAKPPIASVKVELAEEAGGTDEKNPDWNAVSPIKRRKRTSSEESDAFSDGEVFAEQCKPIKERKARKNRKQSPLDDVSDDNDPEWNVTVKEPKSESSEDSDVFSDGEIFAEQCNMSTEPKPRKKRKKETLPRRKRGQPKSPTEDDEGRKKSREEAAESDKQINQFYLMRCDLCGVVEDTLQALRAHFLKVHERRGYIVCCKKKYNKRFALLEHMDLHANPNAFRCELCNKNYKNKTTLMMHQNKTHGSEDERPFKCSQCTQSFAKGYMLKTHMISHQKVQCPTCEKMLSNKNALNVHIHNVHSDIDRRMICDACGQEFLNKVCFERHVKEHKGIEVVKKMQCNICQKWLMGERGLQKHLQYTHYEKNQTHVCDICQQNYPNSRALWSHKKVVHVEEKFECEFCGKKFKRASNLKEHRTIHTGEVLYSCEFCGNTMNSKANLYTHFKKNHPLEWAEKKQKAAEANTPKVQP